jgi:uncharacterized protein (DUF1810 family)
MHDLERFKAAQHSPGAGFETALAEVQAGGKRSHWIWYIFPQLEGLASSRMSQTYAIHGEEEATRFLQDTELRSRLLTITMAVAEQLRSGRALRALMGSDIDVQKLVSSLTLFGWVAKKLSQRDGGAEYASLAAVADEVLGAAASEGYEPCVFTLGRLKTGD